VPCPEAELRDDGDGLTPVSDGWFVVNAADALALRHEVAGAFIPFEARAHPSRDFGANIHILRPGQPNAKYHEESVQEDFLVLSGECVAIIEEQERRLKAWDFVHCPAGTRHVFVGAGDGPCAILMIGARREGSTVHYPASPVAAVHNAAAEQDTSESSEAYADWPPAYTPERGLWPPV
jgi:uncharacterized cupin superfamily protein